MERASNGHEQPQHIPRIPALFVDIRNMTLGGSFGTAKSIGDFLVLEALGQEHNHTLFLIR